MKPWLVSVTQPCSAGHCQYLEFRKITCRNVIKPIKILKTALKRKTIRNIYIQRISTYMQYQSSQTAHSYLFFNHYVNYIYIACINLYYPNLKLTMKYSWTIQNLCVLDYHILLGEKEHVC